MADQVASSQGDGDAQSPNERSASKPRGSINLLRTEPRSPTTLHPLFKLQQPTPARPQARDPSPAPRPTSSLSHSSSLNRAQRPATLDLTSSSSNDPNSQDDTPHTPARETIMSLRERNEDRSRSRSPGDTPFGSPILTRGRRPNAIYADRAVNDFAPRSAGSPGTAGGRFTGRNLSADFRGGFSRPASADWTMFGGAEGSPARARSPRVQIPPEWLERSLEENVVRSMEESFQRRVEALERENKLLRNRTRERIEHDEHLGRSMEELDLEAQLEEIAKRGQGYFDGPREERDDRENEFQDELDVSFAKSENTAAFRRDQVARLVVELNICRARVAQAQGESEDIERYANAALEAAKQLKDDDLKARCAFWLGVALYLRHEWDGAVERFHTSRRAAGVYLTAEEVDNAVEAAEQSAADCKVAIPWRELGCKGVVKVYDDEVRRRADRQIDRIRMELANVFSAKCDDTKFAAPASLEEEHPEMTARSGDDHHVIERPASSTSGARPRYDSESPNNLHYLARGTTGHTTSTASFHNPYSIRSDGSSRPGTPIGRPGRLRSMTLASVASDTTSVSGAGDMERHGHDRNCSLNDELLGLDQADLEQDEALEGEA